MANYDPTQFAPRYWLADPFEHMMPVLPPSRVADRPRLKAFAFASVSTEALAMGLSR